MPLKDVSSTEGTKAVLESKISAQDISSIKWYHNDKLLIPGDRVQAVAKGTKQRLAFTRTFASDEGRYKLVVGKVETSCNLTVERERDYIFSSFMFSSSSPMSYQCCPHRGPYCEAHGGQSVLRVPERYLQC